MFSFKVAMRFLKSKIFQFIVVVFIIAIGTSVFYFILLSTSDLKRYVIEETLKDFSDISYSGLIENDEQQVNQFRNDLFALNNNINAVSLYNVVQLNLEGAAYYIKGVNFEHAGNINDLNNLLLDDPNNKMPQNGPFTGYDLELLVGVGFARQVVNNRKIDPKTAVGRVVSITINGQVYLAKIVGYYYAANLNLNSLVVFSTTETVEKLTNSPYLTGIDININNPFKSQEVFMSINEFVNEKYPDVVGKVWQDQNKFINDIFILEESSIYLIQFFTAATLAFSLATIIFLNTKRKLKQIGVLKALGLNQRRTRLILLFQFLLFAVSGITLGIFLGNIYSFFFSKIVVNSNGNQVLKMPYNFLNRYALITSLVIGGSLVIANLYPILITKRLKIADIIKE